MKKLVSLVLALVMLLSLAPAAFAREAEGGRNFYDYHDYSQFPLGDGSDSAENTIPWPCARIPLTVPTPGIPGSGRG